MYVRLISSLSQWNANQNSLLGACKVAKLTCCESVGMITNISISDNIVNEKPTTPFKIAEAIEETLTHNNRGIKYHILSNFDL